MNSTELGAVADRVGDRTYHATGLRPRFEVVEDDQTLRLQLFGETLVTILPGIHVPGELDDFTPDEIGDWFADELLEYRGWTAADLVSVRVEVLEKQLDRIEAQVARRLATLLRRRFVDPRTCFHGPHGGVVGSLVFDIASAPPAVPDDDAETAWLSIDPVVPNAPAGLPPPEELDVDWPPTGLHIWNETSVEVFIPAGDDPLEPFDVDVLALIEQITIPVRPDDDDAVTWAERELEAHGEAYLRPGDDPALDWDEATFTQTVEAVSSAIGIPHRPEIEGFRARLVRRDDD